MHGVKEGSSASYKIVSSGSWGIVYLGTQRETAEDPRPALESVMSNLQSVYGCKVQGVGYLTTFAELSHMHLIALHKINRWEPTHT